MIRYGKEAREGGREGGKERRAYHFVAAFLPQGLGPRWLVHLGPGQ